LTSSLGPLANLARSAGWLVSAAFAITLTWRRRSKWEPSEEDISGGPARVGALLTAIAIALIWSQLFDASRQRALIAVSLICAGICLVSLLLYGFLVAINTFTAGKSAGERQTKIIGGFWLTSQAKTKLQDSHSQTIQDILEQECIDRVWPRSSRAFAKLCFVLCYLALTVTGSVALASAAVLILLPNVDEGPECHYKDFHGKPLDKFSACAKRWEKLGYWPTTLSITKDGEKFRVSGSFAPNSERKPYCFMVEANVFGFLRADYERKGFRPARRSILSTSEGLRFNSIWVPSGGLNFRSEYDLRQSEFELLNEQLRGEGYVAEDLWIYEDEGQKFSAIWVRRANSGYEVRYDLTAQQLQNSIDDLRQRHFFIRHFVAYNTNGQTLYGAIWEKDVPEWLFAFDLTDGQYQANYDTHIANGDLIHEIVAQGGRYASIWRP
jgi:hypothetical protein